jgi:hypothetical protein
MFVPYLYDHGSISSVSGELVAANCNSSLCGVRLDSGEVGNLSAFLILRQDVVCANVEVITGHTSRIVTSVSGSAVLQGADVGSADRPAGGHSTSRIVVRR